MLEGRVGLVALRLRIRLVLPRLLCVRFLLAVEPGEQAVGEPELLVDDEGALVWSLTSSAWYRFFSIA
jgi:hypothetical protein